MIILILSIFFNTSCANEKYGGEIDPKSPLVTVKDIYLNKDLLNKKVNLEGIIITQCQASGCWFFLKDSTGQIFINLAPKGFTLPPKTGKKAKVTGFVSNMGDNRVIIAEAVEIY